MSDTLNSQMPSLVDMKRAPEPQSAADKLYPSMPREEYPYGLSMHLGEEELQKLGLQNMPEPGSMVQLHAKARVDSVSSDHQADGDGPRRTMRLQVTHLGVK